MASPLIPTTVDSRAYKAPVSNPTRQSKLIIAATAVGLWEGKDHHIATWTGSSWKFIKPIQGVSTWIVDEGVEVTWDGSAWNTPVVTATYIGLDNVNNTSDMDKPVSTATQIALTSLALRAPFRWFYETPLNILDRQPVYRVETLSNLKAIRWFRNTLTAVSGVASIAIYKNSSSTALYTVTIPDNASGKLWVDALTGLSSPLVVGDYLEVVVTAGNATLDNLTVQLDIEQAVY